MRLTALLTLSFFTTGLATCGRGNVGDGVCADSNLCCSQWGWCGTSQDHCRNGPSPPSRPTLPTPPSTAPRRPTSPTPIGDGNSRLIAYLGNWQSCPSAAQVATYTHIVISFAVSYTWSPAKNACSTTCEISEPPICNNKPNPELVKQWRAAGKKVLLSFGGAGMGGSWDGDVNDCWEHCYGRENQVTNRLVSIVNSMGLDGVDIDFEYDVTPKAVRFLNGVTTGLRNQLPAGSEITHAPMDPDIIPGRPYYDDVLKITGGMLDFLMPQYYNGFTRPARDGVSGTGAGRMSALSHYTSIVDDIFSGDAKRMVFGFCIADCGPSGSNANGSQASSVMKDLAQTYPCNGGAFFWVVEHDSGGSWSSSVGATVRNLASGCSSSPSRPSRPSRPSQPTPPTVTPSGWSNLRDRRSGGLCAGTGSQKSNGSKVRLERCVAGWRSQQWKRDTQGRIVNRYSNKCLEGGRSGSGLYSKMFIWTCHNGDHQVWDTQNDKRIRNRYHNDKYLGVAYCGDRSDKTKWLEFRNREGGTSTCGLAQTWDWV